MQEHSFGEFSLVHPTFGLCTSTTVTFTSPTTPSKPRHVHGRQFPTLEIWQSPEYFQRCSARLGTAATWRGRGAEYGEEGIDDHEGWLVYHYDATAKWGRRADIDGERTAGHVINADWEGFSSCSVCPFLAPFSSVFYTPELGRHLKSNNLGNGQFFFFADCLLHLQALFQLSVKMPIWT